MPANNKKGPLGQGPMTGRKMGACTNFGANLKNQTAETKEKDQENIPEIIQEKAFGFGRSRGGGRGRGLGRQNRFRDGK